MINFNLVPIKEGPVLPEPKCMDINDPGLKYVYNELSLNFMRNLFPNNNIIHFYENIDYSPGYNNGVKKIKPYDLYLFVKGLKDYMWYHYSADYFDYNETEINLELVEHENFKEWRGYTLIR